MSDQGSTEFVKVRDALEKIKKNLIDVTEVELSGLHVDHEWSWVPYVKDHVDFLLEQVEGIKTHLRDSPPPKASDFVEELKKSSSASSGE